MVTGRPALRRVETNSSTDGDGWSINVSVCRAGNTWAVISPLANSSAWMMFSDNSPRRTRWFTAVNGRRNSIQSRRFMRSGTPGSSSSGLPNSVSPNIPPSSGPPYSDPATGGWSDGGAGPTTLSSTTLENEADMCWSIWTVCKTPRTIPEQRIRNVRLRTFWPPSPTCASSEPTTQMLTQGMNRTCTVESPGALRYSERPRNRESWGT
ncbi:hypothetical protein EDB85DRAFT_1977397 [Lactarius pseudohatsudake]|nr:hypothetical protein EDB85DRAFT_1977397 [Lactarius pseudohatsudake]